jgi:hypothetical protein
VNDKLAAAWRRSNGIATGTKVREEEEEKTGIFPRCIRRARRLREEGRETAGMRETHRDGGGERRTAGADLASKPGLGARSAAGGGEVPPARGARARVSLLLFWEERRGEERGRGWTEERGGQMRGVSLARRLLLVPAPLPRGVVWCGLANWGWWKRG